MTEDLFPVAVASEFNELHGYHAVPLPHELRGYARYIVVLDPQVGSTHQRRLVHCVANPRLSLSALSTCRTPSRTQLG